MPTNERTRRRRRLRFLRWLSSPAGLAVIALLSSVIGGVVTAILQDVKSDRDVRRTWLQECSKHQMVVRKQYLDEQAAAVERLYESIATLRETSLYLIDITRPQFADANFTNPDELDAVKKQKTEVRDRFNAAYDAWQHARYLGDFRLEDYAGDGVALQQTWHSTRQAATAFGECASNWYLAVFDDKVVYKTKPCVREEAALDDAWDKLSVALRHARNGAWHDWESPRPYSLPAPRARGKPAA
jgi:hypothetical protein